MPTPVIPVIDVQVEWAMHHRWPPRPEPIPSPPLTHSVLWLMLDGAAEVRDARHTWQLLPGMIFLNGASSASLHTRYNISSPRGGEWLSIGFRATMFGQINLLHDLPEPVAWRPEAQEYQVMELWMRQLVREWPAPAGAATVNPAILEIYWRQSRHEPESRGLDGSLIVQGLSRAILGLCWRMLAAGDVIKETQHNIPPWLAGAIHHIHDQPSTTVSDWAAVSGFSPPQFRRLFHQWVGMSPQHYLTQHRLQVARQLLETTDLTMGRIAHQVGFESVSHFTRLFKRDCTVSPSKYRQLAKSPRL